MSMTKKIQFYFPEDLFMDAEIEAKKKGISIAELVRHALKKYLSETKEKGKWEGDPLKEARGFFEGDTDLSSNVDSYVYGAEA